jgi:hypothetical protein
LWERERDRETERQRDRETERQREEDRMKVERERGREGERERERERILTIFSYAITAASIPPPSASIICCVKHTHISSYILKLSLKNIMS